MNSICGDLTDTPGKTKPPVFTAAVRSKPSYDDLAEPSEALGGACKSSNNNINSSSSTKVVRSSSSTTPAPADTDAAQANPSPSPKPPGGAFTSGGYDPAKYEHLVVDPAIKELFQYIGRYQPEKQELQTHIKLFIPEYIPAVGDVDEFLKPPRPDGVPESLGLKVSTHLAQ